MAKMHAWKFFRAGGVDQVVLGDASDLTNLSDLDQKLWVALACPVKGNEIDPRSLELVDSDNDGRIRAPEVLSAIEWSAKVVKSLDLFFEKGTDLPLAQINPETDEGKGVLASAKRILKDRGKREAKKIDLEDVVAMEQVFAATRFNGDGIVPADSSDDEAVKKAIEDIMSCVGSVPDRSGKQGIDKKLTDTFYEEAAAFLKWDGEGTAEGTRPLGDATDAAADALDKVETKIVDYFTRTRLVTFDPRAAASVNAAETELNALSAKTLSRSTDDVARLPISRVEAGKALALETAVNPAWAASLSAFAKLAVGPILGSTRLSLTEADFDAIVAKLSAHRAWRATKPSNSVDKLGVSRLRELTDDTMKASIASLLEEDEALKDDYLQIASVERAIRMRRDLVRLTRNFVNFAEFYGRRGAMFQAGTLYLDARSCELCLFVEDPAKHMALAGLSKAYLAYCDISRKTGEKARIVAAFTAGDTDNIMVGRNGLFYDRNGNDWDATITSVVENPISVRQAFWMPYKRLVRLVEEQIAKRAAAKEKESTAKIDAAAVSAGNIDAKPPAPGAPAPAAAAAPPAAPAATASPAEKKLDLGLIVGISVAIGSIAAFLTGMLAMFLGLGIWMPLGILGILLAISGPSMLIAWLKLRQRNLGPILDANGWAVNGRAKINVPFGGALTDVAALPKGASRTVGDPFAEKPTPWKLYIGIAVVVMLALLWLLGTVDRFVPQRFRFTTLTQSSIGPVPATSGSAAPAAGPPATAAPAAPAPAKK